MFSIRYVFLHFIIFAAVIFADIAIRQADAVFTPIIAISASCAARRRAFLRLPFFFHADAAIIADAAAAPTLIFFAIRHDCLSFSLRSAPLDFHAAMMPAFMPCRFRHGRHCRFRFSDMSFADYATLPPGAMPCVFTPCRHATMPLFAFAFADFLCFPRAAAIIARLFDAIIIVLAFSG